jgi:hypothetical protein
MVDVKRWSAALVLTLAACATTASTPSIYYKSQAEADAALAAFDKDNPDCQLWTNWQKMCSRTGENGKTWCALDLEVPVKPSRPFCANTNGLSFLPVELHDMDQIASAERFIKRLPSRLDAVDNEYRIKMSRVRPFSGKNLGSRRHPYCNVWSRESDGKAICAEGSTFPELPRCNSIKKNKSAIKPVLYCASENSAFDNLCREPAGFRSSRRQVSLPSYPPAPSNGNKEILAVADGEDYILSIYCRK